MKSNVNYSILMSVYGKENPKYFSIALDCCFNQSVKTDDFVLVVDGKVGPELNKVIETAENNHDCLHVVRLNENSGLGNALNVGLSYCKNDFVMRADSDDISLPERARLQMKYLVENDLDIASCNVTLFEGSFANVIGHRRLPTEQDEIRKFSKIRSPFNHPSVMFRKSSVDKSGGYQPLLYREDYYLWVRMLLNGAKAGNQSESLVYMRENLATIKRRSNKDAYNSTMFLLNYMRDNGFSSKNEYRKAKILYWLQRYLPLFIVKRVYKNRLHY